MTQCSAAPIDYSAFSSLKLSSVFVQRLIKILKMKILLEKI